MTMDESGIRRLRLAMAVAGALYALIGVVFGAVAGGATSEQMRTGWRLAAWVVSAFVFGGHIWYEHVQIGSSPRKLALHASLAAALGAFGLAVAANIHSYLTGSGNRPLLSLALLLWPLLTWVPAFLVALVMAKLLVRWRGNRSESKEQ